MSTQIDLERHKRHILLKEIGGPGVGKLASASVSIIGAGALGGPCALYLAAAGIGKIELVDDDSVDVTNFHVGVTYLAKSNLTANLTYNYTSSSDSGDTLSRDYDRNRVQAGELR